MRNKLRNKILICAFVVGGMIAIAHLFPDEYKVSPPSEPDHHTFLPGDRARVARGQYAPTSEEALSVYEKSRAVGDTFALRELLLKGKIVFVEAEDQVLVLDTNFSLTKGAMYKVRALTGGSAGAVVILPPDALK